MTVYSLGGNDTIYLGAGQDVAVGGPGNDRIYARSTDEGGGEKVFRWNAGDGNDTVYYYNVDHQAGDGLAILGFGSGINPEDVEVQNSGNDVVLVVTLATGSGNITFVGANRGDVHYQPDAIHFANGTVWTWDDAVSQKVVRGTSGANTLRASSYAGEKVAVFGLGGNDTLYLGAGQDTAVGGLGNDRIYARSTNEGGGKKIFRWDAGDGDDTVYYYNVDHQAGDGLAILSFGSGINPEDVEVQNSGNDVVLVVTLATGGGNITFVGANRGDVRYQPDEIHFANGTIWTWGDAANRKVVRGTSSANTLRASSYAGEQVMVLGLGGNDTLYLGVGQDTAVPGPGNDTVYARSTSEGGGKKIFLWNAGDGNDTVNYYNADRQVGDELGILIFGEGIVPGNIAVQKSGNNVVLVVTLTSGSGKVTFVGGNRGDVRYQLDKIRFTDGTTWQWSAIPGI